MVRRYGGAMTLDQCLRVPSRLKDGRVHGATARGIAIPHLQLVDALQRLVRTEDKTGDRATDVLKTFLATKDVAKPCQPFGNRLWNPGNWQHVSLPPVCPDSRPSRGASLQRSNLTALSSSLPPFLAITFQVVAVHTLRHSSATHLLDRGVPRRVLQARLGHQRPRPTARSTHLTPPDPGGRARPLHRPHGRSLGAPEPGRPAVADVLRRSGADDRDRCGEDLLPSPRRTLA